MDLGIILHNDTLVVDSLTVADVFNKKHKRVLEDIRKRIEELEALKIGEPNFGYTSEIALDSYFAEDSYTDSQGKEQPLYYMTQKGFTLLAMGYTGQRALEYKVAYIEQFEQMKQALEHQADQDSHILTSEQIIELLRERLAITRIIDQPKDSEMANDYYVQGIYGTFVYYGYAKAVSFSYIRSIRPKVMEIGLAAFEEIVNYCAVKGKLKLAYLKATMQDWYPSEVEWYKPPIFGVFGVLPEQPMQTKKP
ncbi:Rha family transcriptional regulator [Streptococcus acidominimus]|uniref:Phage regulatory protein n=1 Tax=Streptococcus acidominimus TaxID=1326 RepID=A0A4Y9FNN9_STRAI|nr:Rha family transcriptional regulator [Streptococcus acidominimus]MBF0818968.1 Rha family transcriptional regulator [Streptococcus acidominimus]MBF0837893.1 Rha family transcriptional regulator [Streptococcus acidominimus]MBF0846072.1 Rha family transcriptional regulator [Streptococcus danieliae]TFU30482.1 hypothetical protein E4U01_05885 [Streptococcus acidominimus]